MIPPRGPYSVLPAETTGHSLTSTLLFIVRWQEHVGRAATYEDLIAGLGVPRSTIQGRLRRLRALGLVEWDEGRHGSLRASVVEVARG